MFGSHASQEIEGSGSCSSNPRALGMLSTWNGIAPCGTRMSWAAKQEYGEIIDSAMTSTMVVIRGLVFNLELGADGPEHPRCTLAPRVAPHVDWHRQPGHAEGGGCPHNLLDSLLIWFQKVSSQSSPLFSTGFNSQSFPAHFPKESASFSALARTAPYDKRLGECSPRWLIRMA